MGLFDGHDLALLEQGYNQRRKQRDIEAELQRQQQAKQQTGRGGTLTSLISEGGALGGGAAGAAAGTAVLPGIGTLIGGAIGAGVGAFTGRVAENKVRDNRLGIGDAAKEGLVTGLLSAPGKGLKAGYTATKALSKGGTLEEALMGANAAASKPGLIGSAANKTRTSAADKSAQGYGVKFGTTYKGKDLNTDDQAKLMEFINSRAPEYGGIRAGSPAQQARDAQLVYKNVTKELDTALSAIDRPLASQERKQLTTGLTQRVKDDAGVTGTKEITDNYRAKILKAKSIKELEAIRKDADDLAFNTKGEVGGTAKAREASHVRDVIDEFVTGLPDDLAGGYKAVKGDYQLAKQARDLITKTGGKQQNGLPYPFLNGGVANKGFGGNMLATSRNKLASTVANGPNISPTLGTKITGAKMGAQGQLADALINAQPSNSADMSATSIDTATMPMSTDNIDASYQNGQDLSSLESQNPYPRENLIADIQRDPRNADDYIKIYQQYQDVFSTPTEKPMSAEASKVVSNANIGLQALQDFQSAIQQDPSVLAKRVIPGRGALGGAIGGALGTRAADAAAAQIVDVIARLRTGAAITNDEAKRFEAFIPQAGDSLAVQNQKLNYLASQFQAVANRTGSAGGSSLEDALMSSGYGQ